MCAMLKTLRNKFMNLVPFGKGRVPTLSLIIAQHDLDKRPTEKSLIL
jgi:hypothetical protein